MSTRWPDVPGKHVLLVEPDYYTRYPPLGLLKFSSYINANGGSSALHRGKKYPEQEPDEIYVTSLFTWAWKPVWDAIHYYKTQFPHVPVRLGGIYASLLPQHARLSGADSVQIGLNHDVEHFAPNYELDELVKEWDTSLIFASRGCIRKCGFCSVPKLEGRPSNLLYEIDDFILPRHKRVAFFDNNILAVDNWKTVFEAANRLDKIVDFNQGLDARLVTEEKAKVISSMRFELVRMAYDFVGIREYVRQAIEKLAAAGVDRRKLIFYTLYNYVETPDQFFMKVRDLLNWGVVSYPMRFEPLLTLEKGKYVAPQWTKDELQMVAAARRVIGYGGAFPPYEGLVDKFNKAKNFKEAFTLRPKEIEGSEAEVPKEGLKRMDAEHQIRTYWTSEKRNLDWRQGLTGK